MSRLTTEQIKALGEAFDLLDFTQPGAHKLYRMLCRQCEDLVTDTETPWREFRMYALGFYRSTAEQQYKTIPPMVSKDETKGV
jgi:hypothetical protein